MKILYENSPFFIRYTHPSLNKIKLVIRDLEFEINKKKSDYYHRIFSPEIGRIIIKMLPLEMFEIKDYRVAAFDTPPYGGCGIHKDGASDKFSINIPIEVNDNRCVTKWYPDTIYDGDITMLKSLPYSRNIYSDYKTTNKFTHNNEMIAQEDEIILFNTEIFHSWYNNSPFTRKMLTLRTVDCHELTFEKAAERIHNHFLT